MWGYNKQTSQEEINVEDPHINTKTEEIDENQSNKVPYAQKTNYFLELLENYKILK